MTVTDDDKALVESLRGGGTTTLGLGYAADRIEALTAENARILAGSRDNKLHFDVLKADYDVLTAENERLREALREIDCDDFGLQGLIEDGVYEETETSRYYASLVSWRRKRARAALGETE